MAREIRLGLNRPQLDHYREIFGPDGLPIRRRSHFFGWGRGVGKTAFARSIWWLLVAAFEGQMRIDALLPFPGVRITSLCPTLKQWKDINLTGIESELVSSGRWGWLRGKVDRQSGQVRFPGGSSVLPFPASEYNARTARGLRTDVLDAEEMDDISASVYDGVAIPWLSEPWSLGIELLRGTPTRGRHGLWYRTRETCNLAGRLRDGQLSDTEALALPQAQAILEVLENLPRAEWPVGLPENAEQAALTILRGYFGSHATYRDSPETVSPLAVARAKATTPKATFEREWEANPDAGEGLVFAEFDEHFHVRPIPPDLRLPEHIVGIDHGWSDPGVMLRIGIQGHGEDAIAWVLEEYYEPAVPNHVWNQRALAWRGAKFWPDPSRPDRIADLRGLGLDVGETDNSILPGIARISDLLFRRTNETGAQWARLYVSPRCTNLIREFGLYRRKKHSDGSFDEQPEDRNNHALDALRYALLGRFGRPQNFRNTVQGR